MINRDTVFILGAGASQAYGFPSGAKLVDDICKSLTTPNSKDVITIRQCSGHSADDVSRFVNSLRMSRLYSIDAFLQRDPSWSEIGKQAIAQQLLRYEKTSRLTPSAEDDWYRYLFNHLLPTRGEDLHNANLRIVTFNLD